MNKYKTCLRFLNFFFFFDDDFLLAGGWTGLSWGWWMSRMVVVGKEGGELGLMGVVWG